MKDVRMAGHYALAVEAKMHYLGRHRCIRWGGTDALDGATHLHLWRRQIKKNDF
jgi:hypothetical protein